MSHRNPFPFPQPENDSTFTGIQKPPQKGPCAQPTHLAQDEEPWRRLHVTATVSSSRHWTQCEPEAPNDSLDFHLKSVYDQHKDFLRSRNQTLYQPKTISEAFGRTLKNHEMEEVPQNELENDSIRVWINPQKSSVYSIKGTIESHHIASTNRGYSRKHDGGFYST